MRNCRFGACTGADKKEMRDRENNGNTCFDGFDIDGRVWKVQSYDDDVVEDMIEAEGRRGLN